MGECSGAGFQLSADGDWESFSYEFAAGGARFVFVDCRETYSRPATRVWLRGLHGRLAQGERLFVFGHEPLIAVARPYFSAPQFVQILREALRDCPLDAYFCGHTHNQAWTYHPELCAHGALQIKTCVVGERGGEPLPLDQTRPLLIAHPARYLGGYLEDTLPSWVLVEADCESVILTWHRIGNGIEGVLRWDRPAGAPPTNEPRWSVVPSPRPLPAISDAELSTLRAARIYMSFHGSKLAGKSVLLNGTPVGTAPTGDFFAPRGFLSLQPEHLALVRRENTVALHSLPGEKLCWGGVFMEVETASGRRVRSNCGAPLFDTGFGRPDEINAAGIERREPGYLLGPVTVRFA